MHFWGHGMPLNQSILHHVRPLTSILWNDFCRMRLLSSMPSLSAWRFT